MVCGKWACLVLGLFYLKLYFQSESGGFGSSFSQLRMEFDPLEDALFWRFRSCWWINLYFLFTNSIEIVRSSSRHCNSILANAFEIIRAHRCFWLNDFRAFRCSIICHRFLWHWLHLYLLWDWIRTEKLVIIHRRIWLSSKFLESTEES